jgi:glycosyltransferase involved in cell wall biosynthesis
MHTPRYVVVTPVRDEAACIAQTLASMASQSIAPVQWIIVDDGSTDGTSEILDAFARANPWATIVHRANRGFRVNGSGVMDAFHDGLSELAVADWDFMVKLDGDLSFEPRYFELCFAHFEGDPSLGIGGGQVCSRLGNELKVDSVGDPPFHVRGATKIYRRSCWERISPLIKAPGWDTLDEVRANFFGCTTRTFTELAVVQHKPTGSGEGSWRNAVKNGRANYLVGYHPLFMAGKCVRRFLNGPLRKDWLGLAVGYLGCLLKRSPVLADRETVRYLRTQQLRSIFKKPSIYSRPLRQAVAR